MVFGFHRAVSFPAPASRSSVAAAAVCNGKTAAAYRVRSASLPCRFHPLPLVLQLDEDVATLRDLARGLASARSIAQAVVQLGRVLVSLSEELLHHPQAQEQLRRLGRSLIAERQLNDFLCLADAHSRFREVLVVLTALQAEARAALRRKDHARLASATRGLRWSGRDLPRIAYSARVVVGKPPPPVPTGLASEAAALAVAIVNVVSAVGYASAAVFSGVSSLSMAAAMAHIDIVSMPCWTPSPARFASSSATPRSCHTVNSSSRRIWRMAQLMRWMFRAKRQSAKKQPQPDAALVDPDEEHWKAAFLRMDNLGRCIADVEDSSSNVFRALLNTRVFLLNILSQASEK